MSVDTFLSVERSKIDKLPFLKGTYPLGYLNHKDQLKLGVIYKVDFEDYEKIERLLNGKTEKIIGKKDRVFVLTGCKVPAFKIKDYCKKVGAIVTNDIESATVMVGNGNITYNFDSYAYEVLNPSNLIFNSETYLTDELEDEKVDFDSVLKDYYPHYDKINHFLLTKSAASRVGLGERRERGYFITPYAAKIVHAVLSKKIVTITDDHLMKQLPPAIKLDKAVCQQLITMMDSSDEENHKTAHEILANCDYSDADLYLYTIARNHWGQLCRSRYKNVKLFVDTAKIKNLAGKMEDTYLQEKLESNSLVKEELDLLLPLVQKRLLARRVYVYSKIFNIKIELKPEYEKIVGEHQFNTLLNKTTNTDDDDEEI